MGGNLTGEKADLIERKGVPGQGCKMNMPEVDGIEGAAEESDFSRGCHDFCSELYPWRDM